MKITIILVGLMLMGAMAGIDQRKRNNQPVTLCGRKLALAHHLICSRLQQQNIYNKRSPIPSALDDYGWSEEDEFPWTGRRDALNIRWGRSKRLAVGLADECCEKPCTTEEIETYCN